MEPNQLTVVQTLIADIREYTEDFPINGVMRRYLNLEYEQLKQIWEAAQIYESFEKYYQNTFRSFD